jgi:hypothetical protein
MKLLKHIYKPKAELLISGDTNTDFLIEGDLGGGGGPGFPINDVYSVMYSKFCNKNSK